jgi:hypothetical protein
MWWLPWRRSHRHACWHDLVVPDDTRSGEMAEAVPHQDDRVPYASGHDGADALIDAALSDVPSLGVAEQDAYAYPGSGLVSQ